MFVVAEIPLVSYTTRPARTREAVARINDWLGGHGREIAMSLCLLVGVLLLVRGIAHAAG